LVERSTKLCGKRGALSRTFSERKVMSYGYGDELVSEQAKELPELPKNADPRSISLKEPFVIIL
jgi:hypothetical protein